MFFESGVRVPRSCPLCGFDFWLRDNHDGRALPDIQKATEAFEGHDARAHGGLLEKISRWFSR